MASFESGLFYYLLRLINKKRFLEMQFAFGKFNFNNSKEPPPEVHRFCNIQKRQLKGRNVFTLTPKGAHSTTHILYLHGGAYVQSFVRQHWKFMSFLVRSTRCTITAPDYPLAPKSNYRDAFDMLMPLYKNVISESGSRNTILMGDSAGGGLALALAQKVLLEKMDQPRRIILLSPWLDITLKNPEIKEVDRQDPFLSVPGLRKAGLAYSGDSDPENYMLSPVNGPFEGLSPLSIFMGSREILAPDARKLVKLASDEGVTVEYREYKDMVHVWMLLNFRESKQAKKEIVGLITEDETRY